MIAEGSDPRWKMDAPVVQYAEIETPNGLYQYIEGSRQVQLSDPDDPLSLLSQTDVLGVNGRTFTQTYTAATRTMVSETPEGRQSVVRLGTRDELVE